MYDRGSVGKADSKPWPACNQAKCLEALMRKSYTLEERGQRLSIALYTLPEITLERESFRCCCYNLPSHRPARYRCSSYLASASRNTVRLALLHNMSEVVSGSYSCTAQTLIYQRQCVVRLILADHLGLVNVFCALVQWSHVCAAFFRHPGFLSAGDTGGSSHRTKISII
eukprot:SAG31_NODE_3550_length_4134_cov_2.853532_4_plen_169_part_01